MHILPEWDQPKEPVGVLTILICHITLGFGILILGQRLKNRLEFWAGVGFVLLEILVLLMAFSGFIKGVPFGFGIMTTLTWIYVIVRLLWIFFKKETKLTLL